MTSVGELVVPSVAEDERFGRATVMGFEDLVPPKERGQAAAYIQSSAFDRELAGGVGVGGPAA